MSFVRREIDVQFDLGEESYKDVGSRTVTVSGLRVSASIEQPGQPSSAQGSIRIWGMSKKLMNQLSRLGKPLAYLRDNKISLLVGDAGQTKTKVFSGTMFSSYADLNDPPNASLNVFAVSVAVDAAKAADPISVRGPVDVATIMDQIARSMDRKLLNQGVTVQLPTSYLTGSPVDQMRACALAANIYADVDDDFLTIWPKGGSRNGPDAKVLTLSPDNGLIGYPQYTDLGATFRALYQPGLATGVQFEVQSSLAPASGAWIAYGLHVDLESELPGGKWNMTVSAYRPTTGTAAGA